MVINANFLVVMALPLGPGYCRQFPATINSVDCVGRPLPLMSRIVGMVRCVVRWQFCAEPTLKHLCLLKGAMSQFSSLACGQADLSLRDALTRASIVRRRANLCPGATTPTTTAKSEGAMKALLSRLLLLACLVASTAASTQAFAQAYPDRNVTIVVTSAAGALTDVLTRAVAQRLSGMWHHSVIVENKGGAGYEIAAQAVLRAEHDGYTLLASETGFYTTQPYLYAKGRLSYDPDKDFVPVAGYGTIPAALLVNPSLPVNSVSDLIALAKKEPGILTFGSAGVGTALHIAALELENLAGIKVTVVHYRGAAPALTDVIAGHINAVIMGPSVALSTVKAGKLKMLAFASEKRLPQFPDVPTIAETVPRYEASVSFGLFAAAGTPADIVSKVNADVQKIVSDPDFQKKYLKRFAVLPVPGPLDAFTEYLRKDSAKWGEVIKKSNVKIE
jgi:tripartite-type tricarboxylate transporter receptor subunit TctC